MRSTRSSSAATRSFARMRSRTTNARPSAVKPTSAASRQSAHAGSSRSRASVARRCASANRSRSSAARTAVETAIACGPATQRVPAVPGGQSGSASGTKQEARRGDPGRERLARVAAGVGDELQLEAVAEREQDRRDCLGIAAEADDALRLLRAQQLGDARTDLAVELGELAADVVVTPRDAEHVVRAGLGPRRLD